MLKYKLIALFVIISINVLAQTIPDGWEGGLDNPNIGVGAPPAIPEPCEDGLGAGWEVDCENPNIGPGTNVPIDDYLPLLLLAGISFGGTVLYRKQKQLN